MARKEPAFKEEVYLEILPLFDKPKDFYQIKTFPKSRKLNFEKKHVDHIIDLHYNKQVRMSYISYHFGVSIDTLNRVFKDNNLKPKKYWDERYFYRKYKLNDKYFSVIDSDNKAYWLGFLYADGAMIEYNFCVKLELKTFDTLAIDLFRRDLECDYPLFHRRSPYCNYHDSPNTPNMCGVKITNKNMFNDLCRLGCVPRKSKILTFPTDDIVPREFKRSFLRGFTDGDGSINYTTPNGKRAYRISWCGSVKMMEGIKEYLISCGFDTKTKVANVKGAEKWFTEFQIGGNKLAREVINYIYQEDDERRLFRKIDIVDEMNEYLDNYNKL